MRGVDDHFKAFEELLALFAETADKRHRYPASTEGGHGENGLKIGKSCGDNNGRTPSMTGKNSKLIAHLRSMGPTVQLLIKISLHHQHGKFVPSLCGLKP